MHYRFLVSVVPVIPLRTILAGFLFGWMNVTACLFLRIHDLSEFIFGPQFVE